MYSDDAVMLKGLIDNFMSRIDVIMTIYGKYDPHLIGLLDKATYQERVNRISDISISYTNRALELAKIGRLLGRIDNRRESVWRDVVKKIPKLDKKGKPMKTKGGKPRYETVKSRVCLDEVYYTKWTLVRAGPQEWYDMQVDLIVQVQAHFAAFRSIALVEAFKAFQKDVRTALGVAQEEWDDMEEQVDKMASTKAGQFPGATPQPGKSKVKLSEVSQEDIAKMKSVGLKPENMFAEG